MPPTSMDVFESGVVDVVSQYLDAESTARLSRASRSLLSSLVHDDGIWQPKLRVPCFSMSDPSLWRDEAGRRLPRGGRPLHVMSLSTRVLPGIHLPSLRKLEFRMGAGQNVAYTNSASEKRDAFLHLAIGLREAINLEELHLDVGMVIQYESFNCTMIYEAFAKNLARCKNLKILKVMNHYPSGPLQSYYSAGLLQALIPAVAQRASKLEEFTLLIGNEPAVKPSTRVQRNAARNLFLAVLRLRNLRDLTIQLDLASSPLLNVFLDAASLVRAESLRRSSRLSPYRAQPPACAIEKFTLACKLYTMPEGRASPLPAPLSLAPVLALLGRADNLGMFVAKVPPACWDHDAVTALGGVLCDRPTLGRVGLYFHGHECPDGRCLKYLLSLIREREACPDNIIHVNGLRCAGDHSSEELELYYMMDGKKCLLRDEHGRVFKAKGRVIQRGR